MNLPKKLLAPWQPSRSGVGDFTVALYLKDATDKGNMGPGSAGRSLVS